MSRTVPVVATVVVAILVGVVYTTVRNSNSDESDLLASASQNTEQLPLTQDDALVDATAEPVADSITELGIESGAEPEADSLTSSTTGLTEQTGFAQSLARDYVDDETLIKNAEALRNDPELLAAVLDEFLAETDEERLGRLGLLLGQLDDPSLVGVAETMVFSGNPASADAGLDLLRDISADVPAARTVALDVLSSTQDPNLLVGATNIIASVGLNDSDIAQQVVTSMTSLVQHPDARVRRSSYSTLARWSNDPSVTPTLLQGLTDDDPAVRKSTAYGLVGYKHVDASVIAALMQTAENASDTRRARRGAIRALISMTLDDSQSARLQAVQNNLN